MDGVALQHMGRYSQVQIFSRDQRDRALYPRQVVDRPGADRGRLPLAHRARRAGARAAQLDRALRKWGHSSFPCNNRIANHPCRDRFDAMRSIAGAINLPACRVHRAPSSPTTTTTSSIAVTISCSDSMIAPTTVPARCRSERPCSPSDHRCVRHAEPRPPGGSADSGRRSGAMDALALHHSERRYHRKHGGSGRVWQGQYKAFVIQGDVHLLTVLRYVERNALSANLVRRAEEWEWGSLYWRTRARRHSLEDSPVPLPGNWRDYVNAPQTPDEVEAIRTCVNRQSPFGTPDWAHRKAIEFGSKILDTVRQAAKENVTRK